MFFVVVTAAASSLNSLLYSAGRHLYEIAEDSPSPAIAKLGVVSKTKVPARAIIASAILVLLSPVIEMIPRVSGAFVMFSSASSAVIIFIYILTMIAHYRYRNSPQFMANGFRMPAYPRAQPAHHRVLRVHLLHAVHWGRHPRTGDRRFGVARGVRWLLRAA